jgi:hypothetical protein
MYEDIKIKLSPYLGYSKNLMEFFVVIGYEEKILDEISPDNILSNQNLDLSIISITISDLALNIFNPDSIIKQIYPDKPAIIQSNIKPKSTNVIFYSCFDSMDGKKKNLFSCYGLRTYEKYIDINKNEYYVPKAFVILSQYPYFTTFYEICSMVVNNNFEIEKNIPMEILIYSYLNYIPSPIKNNILLKDFNTNIFIPKLTGYPYADFDICKIFNIIPIKDFIKIYILIFLELDLLFFSPNIEKLNIFMYILYILNYPLTDSNYFWHIKSISKNDVEFGDRSLNTSFTGVNSEFDWNLNYKEYQNLNFIIDMENKKNFISVIRSNKESNEINKLLIYIHNILHHKRIDKSYFLSDILMILKRRIKKVLKDYSSKISSNNSESFFHVDKNIIERNRDIQEAFYDFILNILVVLNKDFELDPTMSAPIKNRSYTNSKLSEEEKTFLKYSRNTIKYNTYFDLFIKDFKAADEIKVSLLFSDEYVNLKIKDINKVIPDNIKYFKIMDNLYSLKPGNYEINFNFLYNQFNEINEMTPNDKKKKKNQLFALDQNLIKDFIYHKKNKGYYYNILKKQQESEIEIIENMSIPLTMQNHFYPIFNKEYYIKSALVYIFTLTFPLFSFQDSLYLLSVVFKGLEKIQYFQRFYLYMILKSIHKIYEVNKKNGQFPKLVLNNVINYCQLINAHLINNGIVPNKEIFLFLKKIFEIQNEDKNNKENKENKENKNEKINNNYFIYNNKEENFEKNINNNNIVVREGDLVVFNYKGVSIKHILLESGSLILQTIYSIHDDYFSSSDCNLEKCNLEGIIAIIINVILYLVNDKTYDKNISDFLINSVILLRNIQNDLNIFKEKNKNMEEINNNNKGNNNINNENKNTNNKE